MSRAARKTDRPLSEAGGRWSIIQLMRWSGMIGIVTIAAMRTAVAFMPQLLFDVDPAFDATPLGAMGPVGSMTLDVLLLLACAVALLGEWLTGKGLDGWLVLLALAPLPVVMWHGSSDAGDMWRGSTWLAAAFACVALAHLVRDRLMRVIVIAVLLAAIAPPLMRATAQLTYEHADTVKVFEEMREQIFRERGWDADSPAARIYERRLRNPQPTAWFITTNIFASMMAAGMVLSLGLTVGAVRAKLQSGWPGVMTMTAAAAGAGLYFSASKGAALAMIAGIALLALYLAAAGRLGVVNRISGWLTPGMIALALAGVVFRGAMMSESFLGDKSLLFRWHYMIAAWGVFADQPLVGTGPDNFQPAYMLHRVLRNPEEVTSAHSMFIDWLCMLGIAGAAWIVMTFLLLWRAGRLVAESSQSVDSHSHSHSSQPHDAMRVAGWCIPLIASLAIIPAFLVEWPTLVAPLNILMRIFGLLGFAALGVMAAFVIDRAPEWIVNAAMAAAVAALVVHGQIEMTFAQSGAAVWALAMVGAAGAAHASSRRFSNAAAALAAMALGAAVIWLSVTGIAPAHAQQRAMQQAAAMLRPIAEMPDDAGVILKQRRAAAAELVQAYERWPIHVHPLEAAAMQLQLACSHRDGPQPLGMLADARDLAHRAVAEHGKISSISLALGIDVQLAQLTNDDEYWQSAVALAQQMTEMDPNGLSAWRRLGDVLWLSGQRTEAVDAYQRALAINEQFELDEFKQLSERDRRIIEQRIAELQGSSM